MTETTAPQASANAATKASESRGGRLRAAVGRGDAEGDEYGESVPSGGMPSGNPVAVAFMNFARATVRGGEDQTGESGAREETARRQRSQAHSRGGHSRTACEKDSSPEEHLGHVGRTGFRHQSGRWAAK